MFIFNIVTGFCSFIGLLVSSFTLWKVGTIKKTQKDYEAMILFNNMMEEQLIVLNDINNNFRKTINNGLNELDIKEHLASLITVLEIICDYIPEKYRNQSDLCKKLIKMLQKQTTGNYSNSKKNNKMIPKIFQNNYVHINDLYDTHNHINSFSRKMSRTLESKSFLN